MFFYVFTKNFAGYCAGTIRLVLQINCVLAAFLYSRKVMVFTGIQHGCQQQICAQCMVVPK